ncbi:UDP-xylose and UDP-N-acetylglucosamine transporter-like [Macrosteles quadrilineatus]|uniref:UDP-xylose and UDP-N-acetylglucosamine transporter-like n=1 Tax=Macrosteles quadrilineatus TaxID=74068 RepID=UPI0023E0C4A6|nr:UDP-xylose and UDP-N-acetylglucosamine transporter-like [Macrosteles quadrilineatus]
MGVFMGIASVFLGCCSNVVFLELLVKEDPGSGNLITFAQFLFVVVHGFIFTMKWGTKKPNISIWNYTVLVVMFFVVNVFNNYAFDFNVAMPLHMIFRAGSLIANMIMGIIILKKTYSLSKYVSVGLITLGIAICTVISGQDVKKTGPVREDAKPTTEVEDFFWWSIGILLLTTALFMSARMGIYQEELNKKYGKNPKEALYFTHLLPLPAFALLYNNIYEHLMITVNSTPMQIPVLPVAVPILLVYLLGNVVTQYLCISSVYYLTSECSSLTVTLVITLRKFVSLLFSILYFKNPFTIYHWVGTTMVFVGTLIFTEVPQKVLQSSSAPAKAKKAQ